MDFVDKWVTMHMSREVVWSNYHSELLRNQCKLAYILGSKQASALLALHLVQELVNVNCGNLMICVTPVSSRQMTSKVLSLALASGMLECILIKSDLTIFNFSKCIFLKV